MFQFQLGPEFKSGAGRLVRPWSPVAGQISQRILEGARSVVIGGVAGWGIMVVAGAILMSNTPREVPPAATVETKPVETPAPKVEAAPVAAAPAPAPSPIAKSTQRVDMTPTAAIPAEPAPKPKHKQHKKKPKDLDNHN